MEESKTPEPTPDQLLKLLDLQLEQARRARSVAPPQRRVGLLVGALILIIVSGALALLIIERTFAEFRLQGEDSSVDSSAESVLEIKD